MSEVSTMERVIRSDVSKDECKKIEKVLRKNNISYFERWKFHTGLLRFLNNDKNAKCDILVHMDSFEKARIYWNRIMRILGRIVEVRSNKQSVGIKVGGF